MDREENRSDEAAGKGSTNDRINGSKNVVRRVYTSGQISRLCMVAPRTVSKWIDDGDLVGHRIGEARRVFHCDLVRFLHERKMLPILHHLRSYNGVLCVCLSTPHAESIAKNVGKIRQVREIDNLFDLGVAMEGFWRIAVIDVGNLGRSESALAVDRLRERGTFCLVLTTEDDPGNSIGSNGEIVGWGEGTETVQRSEHPDLLAGKIEGKFREWDGPIDFISDLRSL